MKLQFAVAPLLAITVFTATPGHAQQETFSDTASVLVVEVPVRVLRDGRPVRDLTAADFELFDRRRRVETFGLDVLDFSSAADAAPPIPMPPIPMPPIPMPPIPMPRSPIIPGTRGAATCSSTISRSATTAACSTRCPPACASCWPPGWGRATECRSPSFAATAS